jgi:hypothetical protein
MMDHRVTELERAFQLAGAGKCFTVEEIKKRLIAEGYSGTHLYGCLLETVARDYSEGIDRHSAGVIARGTKHSHAGCCHGREQPQAPSPRFPV